MSEALHTSKIILLVIHFFYNMKKPNSGEALPVYDLAV